MITKGPIQVSIRLKAEAGWVPWGSFVDLHWSISLAYISNILINCKLYNRGGIATLPPPYAPCGKRILIAGYRPAQEFVIERSSWAHRFGNSNWPTQFTTM